MPNTNPQDQKVLEGEVRSADFDSHTLSLRLTDRSTARCLFAPVHEPVVTQALAGLERHRLRIRGTASSEGGAQGTVRVESAELVADQQPIWEVALAIAADMPAEVADSLPEDASTNYRSYLYGR